MTIKKKKKIPIACKGINFKTFQKEVFRDKAFKEEFEDLRPEFELLEQFIQARKKTRMSQADLAKKLKSQQPAIARLENGGYVNTSIANLTKVANVLGYSIHVSLRAKKKS